VPLEITELLRKDGATLKEKLGEYEKRRGEEFQRRHDLFLRDSSKAGARVMQSFQHALACTTLSLPLDDVTCLDRQLMFMRDKYVFALTPLALKEMRKLSPDGNKLAMDVAFDQVFSDNSFTNDTKGRVLEKYLIDCLGRNKLWRISAKSLGPKGGKRNPLKMQVAFSQVLHFAGNETPVLSDDVNLKESAMFVPFNSNYPAVDLLIWDAKQMHLFAIQVTVREMVSDHMKENADKWPPLAEKWKKFCGAKMVDLIWVSDNDERGEYKTEWVVLLSDIMEQFPLLTKFKRCPSSSKK
jgi:hypothetical protein